MPTSSPLHSSPETFDMAGACYYYSKSCRYKITNSESENKNKYRNRNIISDFFTEGACITFILYGSCS